MNRSDVVLQTRTVYVLKYETAFRVCRIEVVKHCCYWIATRDAAVGDHDGIDKSSAEAPSYIVRKSV